MKFQNYNTTDFILDEDFQQWVLAPDTDSDIFWMQFLRNNPQKEAIVEKAKVAVLELYAVGVRKEERLKTNKQQLPVAEPSPAEISAIWQKIAEATRSPDITNNKKISSPAGKVIPFFSFRTWTQVAASVLLLLFVGYFFWARSGQVKKDEYITYATAFGETKIVSLPDQSRVFLNANSRISFAKNWPEGKTREVALAGEAFFSVVHKAEEQKFKVSFSEGAQVEVLGTEFTVTDRASLTRVVLNKGRVKVGLRLKENDSPNQKVVKEAIMVPGDVVEINSLKKQLHKTQVLHPESYAAFIQNKFEFNNSPLAEVARVLQDDYGYKVTFVPATLAQKRFTSSNPSNRIDLLLFAIEKSFNLQVLQKGKNITIKAK